MSGPTAYSDLNDILEQLVAGARSALGSSFVGAYLQGSFALGEADEHSDVDFVVVAHRELDDVQEATLQELHSRLFELDVPWAQHLEGSYAPKDELRRVDPSRTPWPYLDNGARRLVRSDHCNTAHVRWILREHGVVLAGPAPRQLVDPVSQHALREGALQGLQEYAAEAHESRPFSRWQQPYLVLTFCRLLWTLEHGAVTTKRHAAEWALSELDPEWSLLIGQAIADRPDPWERVRQPSSPEAEERTFAFITHVLDRSRRA